MADNKNQHFVPKCHFKPFSLNNKGMAINVYNHKRDKIFTDASIKGQCSRSYFYGKDLRLENLLHHFESEYATVIKKLTDNKHALTLTELKRLRGFAYLQLHRTEANIKLQTQTFKKMDEAAHKGHEEYRDKKIDLGFTHEAMLIKAIRAYADSLHTILDLKVVILENRTPCDFITSDDPSILTNKLYVQRLRGRAVGTMSSGVQLVMPLTPRHCLVCYDEDTYLPTITRGYVVTIDKVSDVHALNELQLIRCSENVYFKDIEQKEYVQKAFRSVSKLRPDTWVDIWVGVPTNPERTHFRRATEEEKSSSKKRLITFNQKPITPSTWLSALPYRAKIYGYTNGSAVGHLRKGQIKEHEFLYMWKEEVKSHPKIKRNTAFLRR